MPIRPRSLARALVRRATQFPPTRPMAERVVAGRRRDLLVASGIVDRQFYGAQLERVFDDDASAVEHYLAIGHENGLSLTPLYQESWYREATGNDQGPRFLSLFFGDEPLAATSPLFDAVVFAEERRRRGLAVPTSTREALAAFLDGADEDTVLPTPDETLGTLTWGAARRIAIRDATVRSSRRRRLDEAIHVVDWDAERAEHERRRLEGTAPDALVSVVMPVRDREDLVLTAIASVQAQSHERWELIVVDDGSTDGTLEVLRGAAAADDRIVVVAQPPRGVCAARNTAVDRARGRYLAFLDSDNRWTPWYLGTVLAALDGSSERAAYAAAEFERDDGSSFTLSGAGTREDLFRFGNFIDLNTFMAETSLVREVGGFDEKLRRWVDFDLFIRVLERTDPLPVHVIGAHYDFTDRVGRISTNESSGWDDVVRQKYLIDWSDLDERLGAREPGLVSILLQGDADWRTAHRQVCSILAAAEAIPTEVVVVGNGAGEDPADPLMTLFAGDARITYLPRFSKPNRALGTNLALAASRGEFLCLLDMDTRVERGWLAPLLETMTDAEVLGVQPIHLSEDGRIASAGSVFGGPRLLPWTMLAGHPIEDAGQSVDLHAGAISAAAMVLRAQDLIAVRGFDPRFVEVFADTDCCLRLSAQRAGRFAVDPRSVAVVGGRGVGPEQAQEDCRTMLERWRGTMPDDARARYQAYGLQFDGVRTDEVLPLPAVATTVPEYSRASSLVVGGPHDGRVVLRWAVKSAAPSGVAGDTWGDTAFAGDLADALRSLDQLAVVDRRERHRNAIDHLEDVVVVLRGLDLVAPNPGAVNILWVISHPELVTDAELHAFDLVYAASASWAAQATARTGVTVRTLLQATPAHRFRPAEGAGVRRDPRPLFIGSTRGVYRPIVRSAVEGGLSPRVIGPGWEQFIDAGLIEAQRIDRDGTAAAYRSAGVVLNDHWDSMARAGFVSNRLFDAVASGARVVSDRVAGLTELFEGAVIAADTPEELRRSISDPSRFPSDDEMGRIADRVRREHSFDARASVLLDDVAAWSALNRDRLPHRRPRLGD
jgi:GT2 family glycosyltransferase